MFQWFGRMKKRLPSWSWAFILLLTVFLVIAVPAAFIYVISHFEGVASVLFLVIGWFVFGRIARSSKPSPLLVGGIVAFYALMGMAIDQMGNRLYNLPLGLTCPEGTTFGRSVVTLHPLPGRTDFVQDFKCVDSAGKMAYRVPIPVILGVRLGEYVLIAYLLLGIGKFVHWIRKGRRGAAGGRAGP